MFKVLTKGCEPTRGSKYSACVDLYASEDVVIGAGETKLVGLGVCININELTSRAVPYKNIPEEWYKDEVEKFLKTHYIQLMLRSSLAKKGLIIANGVGVIDLVYKDEIKIAIHNPISDAHIDEESKEISRWVGQNKQDSFGDFKIKKGDRIAQITLLEHKSHLFGIESDEERNGGFGSTGE